MFSIIIDFSCILEQMSYEDYSTENQEIDYKVSKKQFPRINNSKVLEFVFDKDPNLHLRKNKIVIRGHIEMDPAYIVENGFVSKLFSMLTIELNSQVISRNLNRLDQIYCL